MKILCYNIPELYVSFKYSVHMFTRHLGRIGRAQASHVECREFKTPGQVKPMTNKIDMCRFLVWHSALIGEDKDWLPQYHDNVTVWDFGSWCWWPDFLVGKHYPVGMNAQCHKSVHDLRCC